MIEKSIITSCYHHLVSSCRKTDARVICKGSDMGYDRYQAPGCHGAFRVCDTYYLRDVIFM